MARTLDAALLLVVLFSATLQVLAVSSSSPPTADPARCRCMAPRRGALAVHPSDMEQLQFLLNAKFVEAEWFLHAALGQGVDALDRGGPRPVGARRADLDFHIREVAAT